ncbi:two-component system phosphate regulon sensor histidine kinase PhoR [Alkalibacillus filiformis]|uniref:histidine kinase n=1 Tax=Alkalibacillus filiformis TaxID=200990 RepID=A0ABU0DS05_9BACI|nr:ATP-binding protein [Alkalibacillus filiformis]MDQ0351227.1 two-component system phosphate regulon sensor histidine kinase PhoR [Alkalibacillus filiformis]
MKNIIEKRTIILYIILSILFIVVIGAIFNQIAKHYVISSYESQLQSNGEYISEQLEMTSIESFQHDLVFYHEQFNVDLFYESEVEERLLHTFNTTELNVLRHLRGNLDYVGEIELIEDRLITTYQLEDGEFLTIATEKLPLTALSTTIWWGVFFFSLFATVLLWSFGNRLYDSYVKPVIKATETSKELVDGNYQARIHDAPYGIASSLSQSINRLGRYLEYITSKYENQNSRLKTVVNNMESGALLINEKGVTRLVNESFLQQFSIETTPFIGEIYYEVVDQDELNGVIQEAIFTETKQHQSIELKDGRFIEVFVAPIKDQESHHARGVVVVSHDITDLKRLERVRKDFVANVSHELRTPITSIQGFAETLLDDDSIDEQKQKQFLKIMKKESKRLNILVQDLLDLSVLEKDEYELKRSTFTASKLVNDIKAIVEQPAQEKKLNLNYNVDEDLEIHADYYRLYQLALNLISNSIQYTNEGGEITLIIEKEDADVLIKVQDDGIGIAEKFHNRIFERFYRVDKARSRHSGGTGLGLSIVRHITEAHDGHIQIESREEVGTTIKVSLPQK